MIFTKKTRRQEKSRHRAGERSDTATGHRRAERRGAQPRRRIDLCREIADEFNEAIGHQEFGRVLVLFAARGKKQNRNWINWRKILKKQKLMFNQVSLLVIPRPAFPAHGKGGGWQ